MSDILHLPDGFSLRHNISNDRYELAHHASGILYAIQDPVGFRCREEWVEHIERTAGTRPGTFQSAMRGFSYGQYRSANASNYGSATARPGYRAGRPNAFSDEDTILSALNAGHISHSEAYTAICALRGKMAHHALMPYSGLGGGIQQQNYAAQQHAMMQLAMQAQSLRAVQTPPHSPTSLKSSAIIAGEIIAWRAWNIVNGALVSVVAEGKPWSATEPMKGDAAAGYGVHAYKTPHGPLLDDYVAKGSSKLWVIGEVALWGDIIEHEHGYRAEYARVHSLVTWNDKVSPGERNSLLAKYIHSRPILKIEDAA